MRKSSSILAKRDFLTEEMGYRFVAKGHLYAHGAHKIQASELAEDEESVNEFKLRVLGKRRHGNSEVSQRTVTPQNPPN
jgi:hypothetical protein